MKAGTEGLSQAPDEQVTIFGVEIRAAPVDRLIETLLAGDPTVRRTVLYANPHVLNVAYRDRGVRDALRDADLVYVDGVGIRIAARLLGVRLSGRTTAADWIDDLCARAALRGRKLFLVAGAPGVAAEAADHLRSRHPNLHIAGTHHGFLDTGTSRTVVQAANQSEADLVLVGMGTPTQERWIARHRDLITAPVVWAVGGLLDFVVGTQQRAPRWIARNHMEWLWRLALDPRRLGGRYVIGNPLFLARVLGQRFSGHPSGDHGHDF